MSVILNTFFKNVFQGQAKCFSLRFQISLHHLLHNQVICNVKSSVITATTRNDVLILPLSVIAGRQGTGLVTVITPNGERVETKVTLGVTDGANIEILSGLEEGDVVSATPPNLDPRGI